MWCQLTDHNQKINRKERVVVDVLSLSSEDSCRCVPHVGRWPVFVVCGVSSAGSDLCLLATRFDHGFALQRFFAVNI